MFSLRKVSECRSIALHCQCGRTVCSLFCCSWFLDRYIMRLGRAIKQRKHPEMNLCNVYCTDVASQAVPGFEASTKLDRLDATHGAVSLGATYRVNSVTGFHVVQWPVLTRHTRLKVTLTGNTPQHARRTLVRLLGPEVCRANAGASALWTSCWATTRHVWIGMWRYITALTEKRDHTRRSVNAWFCIKMGNIPQVVDAVEEDAGGSSYKGEPWEHVKETLVYGQFRHFVEITVPSFNPPVYLLGRCYLYGEQGRHAVTGVPWIDVRKSFELPPRLVKGELRHSPLIDYVHLDRIETQLALLPQVRGFKHVTAALSQRQRLALLVPSAHKFWIVPMQK